MSIIWSETAHQDLNSIWNFIAEDSEYYATNFTSEVIFSVDQLEDLPKTDRIVPKFNNSVYLNRGT